MSASTLSDSFVFARRNLEHIRQIPEKLTEVTVQPLMFTLLFAYVFGWAISVKGGGYKEYLIGGILIQSLAFAMMGPATAIATDLQEGVIDRFRVLPTKKSAYMLGHYFAELAGSLLAITVLMVSGLVVGWRPHTSVPLFLEALLLLIAFSSSMIWLGLWLGSLVRSPDAVMGIGFVIVFPITFLSNAFVPLNTLPGPLQWVASGNPISVLVAAIRTLFGNPVSPVTKHLWPIDHPVVASWIYVAVLLAVGYTLAQRRYAHRTRD
jgi:ABC-2 type transport system permease protein